MTVTTKGKERKKKEKGAQIGGRFLFTGLDGHRVSFKIYADTWIDFLWKLKRQSNSNNLIKAECEPS